MGLNLTLTDVDRECYAEQLREFLPPRLIDVHTHVWLDRFLSHDPAAAARVVSWPARVAAEGPVEDLLATYRLLFPAQTVTPLLFGMSISRQDDIDAGNAYVAESAARHGCPALLFATPEWSAAELETKLDAGGFAGVKVYLSLADPRLAEAAITIFDFLPHHQLAVLDRRQAVVMLHVPRPGRLRDPVNLEQLLEIEARYPHVQLIVAHVGRAYCPEDLGNAFAALAGTRRMCFDISANTNETVFRALIEAVGPRRILFGSDLPITRMRMRRVCEAGNYVNLVPRGLYGDVTGDSHMREVDGTAAAGLTLFLYEEILAFRRAAEAAGLGPADIEAVFHGNAQRLLAEATQVPSIAAPRQVIR